MSAWKYSDACRAKAVWSKGPEYPTGGPTSIRPLSKSSPTR